MTANIDQIRAGLAAGNEAMEQANGHALAAAEAAGQLSVADIAKQMDGIAGMLEMTALNAEGLPFPQSGEKRDEAGQAYRVVLEGAGQHPDVKDLVAHHGAMGESLVEGMQGQAAFTEIVRGVGAAVTALAEKLRNDAEPQTEVAKTGAENAAVSGASVIESAKKYEGYL